MRLRLKKLTINGILMLLISVIFFLVADLFLSHFFRQMLVDKFGESGLIRTTSFYYHHDLIPNQELILRWGDVRYKVCTNQFGFKSSCKKMSNISNKKYDIGFIGDSFVEGVGLGYEKTFVGMFEKNNPNLSIANLGVSSYSPSTIYKKLEYLLNRGFHFNEIIVFMDISDIQDEGLHVRIADGIVVEKSQQSFLSPDSYWGMAFLYAKAQLKKNLILTFNLEKIPKIFAGYFNVTDKNVLKAEGERSDGINAAPFKFGLGEYYRSEWTYNKDSKAYGEAGVSGAIFQALEVMSKLHLLLKKHESNLTVVVYPWPMQLMRGDPDNLSVTIWENFCSDKCKKFINVNPVFFNELDASSLEHIFNKYYLKSSVQNDIHFNENGNKLIYEILEKNILGQ